LVAIFNTFLCLLAVVIAVVTVAMKIAAIKTSPRRPGESWRDANKPLNQAAHAEL